MDITDSLLAEEEEEEEEEFHSLLLQHRRKSKEGGGFGGFGLSPALCRAIAFKGFKVPTPIQRKCIPPILQGRDVVGMARTGSGKTAAFVLPMVEKLKAHGARAGARGVILAPSRELALQTAHVVKEFCKGTDLKSVLVVGGDSLEDQFAMLAGKPDIVLATPGRFLHVKVEMQLDLSSVEYMVFDEADRLFEMGFGQQLAEILHALPAVRQTLLFSATLPKSLVELAKAGLSDPLLVRLDVDTKISTDLQSAFFSLRPSETDGALLFLLAHHIHMPIGENVVGPEGRKRKRHSSAATSPHSTIIFASTKHHVEYLLALLQRHGYAVSYVYGSLDQTARLQQIDRFRQGVTSILLVTDVAARGIDIPMLSNVINYSFPSQPKNFVHRVGRTARAGRTGWSFSFVHPNDAAYLIDLQLFLGRNLVFEGNADYTSDVVLGRLPREELDQALEGVAASLAQDTELSSLREVANRSQEMYLRSRPAASGESMKRARGLLRMHWESLNPLFHNPGATDHGANSLLSQILDFKPHETVFEIGKRGTSSEASQLMKRRRVRVVQRMEKTVDDFAAKDHDENYISYQAPDSFEKSYSLNESGDRLAAARMELLPDDMAGGKKRWDAKQKKFVMRDNDFDGSKNGKKTIRGESGARIPASYRSGRYDAWKSANKDTLPTPAKAGSRFRHHKKTAPKPADKARDDYHVRKQRYEKAKEEGRVPGGGPQSEIKSSEAIGKARKVKELRRQKNARPARRR